MKRILKWAGVVVLVLVVVIVGLGGFVYVKGGREAQRTETVVFQPIPIPADSAAIARGEHLAIAINKCVHCHGENLGGGPVIDAMPFMRLYAPNLTRGQGGVGASLNDADWVRALRHGVAPDGRRLVLMPADAYSQMSDQDLGAVVAYAKSRPPVNQSWPAPAFGPIARMLLYQGKFPLYAYDVVAHQQRTPAAPAASDTAAYGHYLMEIGGCYSCHGPNLSGGPIPGMPPDAKPAANLTPTGIGSYTEADFARILRTGMRPSNTPVDTLMPWKLAGKMTDAEIHAVYAYLRTVRPAEYGAR